MTDGLQPAKFLTFEMGCALQHCRSCVMCTSVSTSSANVVQFKAHLITHDHRFYFLVGSHQTLTQALSTLISLIDSLVLRRQSKTRRD